VIAEGNETPGGESGGVPEGRRPPSEGDILAERRARRAAESGEHALTLRAEAAEATVRTLETHVTSLQQQLRESEEEGRRLSERIDSARVPRAEQRAELAELSYPPARDPALERELQRASQREYAEQRLRIEAEDRCGDVERDARTELDRLSRRLDASERDAQTLGTRLETAERELAEAEQALAAQRAAVLRSERALRERLSDLERQAERLHSGLEAERSARERAEQMLAALQQAQRGAQLLLSGLADTVARLREATLRPREADPQPLTRPSPPAPLPPVAPLGWRPAAPPPPEPSAPGAPRSPASIASTPDSVPTPSAPVASAQGRPLRSDEAGGGEMAEALAAAVERLRARVEEQTSALAAPAAKAPPHKHTMSLIARTRLALRRRREQRKQRRTA
jgi:hypothetical protein